MSDNKKLKGKQDRIKVDSNDSNEISYLKRNYPGFSRLKIAKAIKKAGPVRKNIIKHLDRLKLI